MSWKTTTSAPAIVTRGLTKYYGKRPVVHDLNLSIPAGCVYGFLGRNGAGKSTTIKMLTGMIHADFGEAALLGHNVAAMPNDVRARIAVLSMRAGMNGGSGDPDLDEDGVLRFRGQWVGLPPVEARLTRALLERYGSVVSRETLTSAGWPGGAPGRNALDVHVLRLRRRLDPIGLAIRTVRSRGYLLEDAVQPAWRITGNGNGSRMATGSPR